jgi:glycosyltransferase involved in cell wall biosynthesis
MRILVFCDEDLGVPGGGARQVLELSRGLAARGHTLRVLAPSPVEPRAAARALRGLECREVPVIRGPGLRPLSYLLGSRRALQQVMTEWRPDVLLWFEAPGQIAPLSAIRRSACPYVLFVNGLPEEELTGVWAWAPIRTLVGRAFRCATREAEAVVGVCEELLQKIQERCGVPRERCQVVRNGVDPAVFAPMDGVRARHALGLDGHGPWIMFIGGFFPWHGLDVLVEAMPLVLRASPSARCLLVGDGPMRPSLVARAQALGVADAVRVPGRVPFEQVPQWIAAGDVCVVLHRATRSYPGDSMKLWEYLACARPVVATAGPGYGDVVESLGCGASVKPDDPADLARVLLAVLEDAPRRAAMGERGRRAVLQAQTWAARAEELERLLGGVARGRS